MFTKLYVSFIQRAAKCLFMIFTVILALDLNRKIPCRKTKQIRYCKKNRRFVDRNREKM